MINPTFTSAPRGRQIVEHVWTDTVDSNCLISMQKRISSSLEQKLEQVLDLDLCLCFYFVYCASKLVLVFNIQIVCSVEIEICCESIKG